MFFGYEVSKHNVRNISAFCYHNNRMWRVLLFYVGTIKAQMGTYPYQIIWI